MIKRFELTRGGRHRRSLAWDDAPQDVRPVRVTACTPLGQAELVTGHDLVLEEWFDDAAHLLRFDGWSEVVPAGDVVVAEEHVLRGQDWLVRRWTAGGPKLKHMAVAMRAAGLTAAEFQDRWRNRAGSVGTTPIPDEAKGLAYVQNHPVPGEWAYDAVNEVWFDDEDALQVRVRWFAANLGDTEDDLVGAHWFLPLEEELVVADRVHK